MAHCSSVRSGRRHVEGKPRTYGKSPDKMDGPTRGTGGGVDGEARTEAKRTHQVGRSRGGTTGRNPVQPGAAPSLKPEPNYTSQKNKRRRSLSRRIFTGKRSMTSQGGCHPRGMDRRKR